MKGSRKKWFYLGMVTGFFAAFITFIVLMFNHHHPKVHDETHYGQTSL